MKTTIRVSCVDQVLRLLERPILASGGMNESVVAFDFCEKWNGFIKTGVFYRDEECLYYSLLDENDTCIIPWEVYIEPGTFYFTIFGVKDDIRKTANTLRYRVKKGIVGDDMIPSTPTPAVYEQIITRLEAIEQDGGVSAEQLANAVNEALAQAKASGEFKGEPGERGQQGEQGPTGPAGADGKDGADGKTPVKGTDYYTEADKTEMVSRVLSALPTWNGGSY